MHVTRDAGAFGERRDMAFLILFACKASLRSCIMLTVMRRARCQYATMIAANRYTAMKMNMATELVVMVVAQSPLRP